MSPIKLYEKEEVMSLLGISESKYHKLIREGILSYFQDCKGGKTKVPESAIRAYVLDHMKQGIY